MRNWLLLLVACSVSACATNGPTARALRAQQNTAVVLAFLDTAFNKHEVKQAFKLYVGPYYRQHNPHVADGVDGAIAALTHLTQEVYPELRQDVTRTVAQGDLVAVHSRYTHGPAERAGSGGEAVVDIFRLEKGKIVEHWDVVESVPEMPANDNSMF
ncbi:MAG TPA: nuclear transport factor 2 family protein [Steroidobacteraceae bacterium]|nr:nuclear transport factor 2 family protein [Steroidobacteraceae bacterium]